MNLQTLLSCIDTMDIDGKTDVEIKGIAYDSRAVKPGWLFVAVSGGTVDGTGFITEAVSKGAVAVVSENNLRLGAGVVHAQVRSARQALAEIANTYFGNCSSGMRVIGITGTNGKTTTAFMTRDILRDGGFMPGLLGTVSYELGGRSIPATRTTPEAPDIHALFRQMKESGCDSAVMEVSSHAIALQRVHGIEFSTTVFTNLTQDHLDFHKDMDTYFNVKAQLFQSMERRDGRSAVINIDDPWGRKLVEECGVVADVVTYGFTGAAMVHAKDARIDAHGTTFEVSTPWGDAHVGMKLLGRFNIHNALAALAVGGLAGIDLKRMVRALGNIHSIPGRLELVPNRKEKKVFVDYAHTDDALRNVLSTLREICKGRLIVVFGCGGDRDQGKREKMGHVAAALADYSFVTSDNPRNEDPGTIASAVAAGFDNREQFEVLLDRRAAIEKGIRAIGRKDILLIAGKGHEAYQETKGAVVPFDDRETVKEILRS
jgi:UDP-N-acetylmuramoyl-L-alanyl-D-glutamate--2,6-diaminopimelate ligase